MTEREIFPVIASASEAIHLAAIQVWIASSRSLSSGAHSRDPSAPRNDEFDPIDLPAMANQIWTFGLRQINPTGKSLLIFRNGVKPVLQKYFCFPLTQISSLIRPSRSDKRGVAQRHQRGAGCGGRGQRARRARSACVRPKSCGSDAPILGVTPVRRSAGDGVKQRGHRGEREVSRKAIARGMPGRSGVTVVTNSYAFFTACEASGALGARHSLRPLFSERRNDFSKPRAPRAAGMRRHG